MRCLFRGFCLLFAILLLLLPLSVFAAAEEDETDPATPLSYTRGEIGQIGRLTGTELYSALFGTEPSPAAGEYLAARAVTLEYGLPLPDGIATGYDSETGTLTVRVREESFTAENGETVTWIPRSVSLGEDTFPLTRTEDGWECAVGEMRYSVDFTLSVNYEATIPLDAKTCDALRNGAYRAGAAAIEAIDAYDRAYADYLTRVAAYEAYQAYLADCETYRAYLEYLPKKQAYDAYRAEYEAYLADLAAYDAWQQYYAEVGTLGERREAYRAYLTYLSQMEPILRDLAILDSMFVVESHGWQLYGSIVGESVTRVLAENRETLVDYFLCSAADIDLAGDATVILRDVLPRYDELRGAEWESEYERTCAMFAFYEENYATIRDCVSDLCRALSSLIENDGVRRVAKEREKLDHYYQFVAQLYIVATALDDEVARNDDWTIIKKTLSSLIDDEVNVPDRNNADPEGLTIPAYAPYAEKPNEQPTPPEVPQPATRPEAPMPIVRDPGAAPSVTEEPTPIPAATQPEPFDEEPPVTDPLTDALIAEIRGGLLTEVPVSAPMELRLSASEEKAVSIRNLKTVTFYRHDGTVLSREQVDYGTPLQCPDLPDREADAQYTYTPRGWQLAGGGILPANVTEDLSIVPAYGKTRRTYTVTWQMEGEEPISVICPYGMIPSPPQSLPTEKPDDGFDRFVFSGWSPAIAQVTGNATYTASFVRTRKTATVTWITADKTISQTAELGTLPQSPEPSLPAADAYIYAFSGWSPEVTTLTGDISYTAVYRKTPLATIGGIALPVTHGKDSVIVDCGDSALVDAKAAARFAVENEKSLILQWNAGVALSFSPTGAARLGDSSAIISARITQTDTSLSVALSFAGAADEDIDAVLSVPFVRRDGYRTVFSTEGAIEPTEDLGIYTLSGDGILLRSLSYDLTAKSNQYCNTAGLSTHAESGETVSLDVDCADGYRIRSVTVTTLSGEVVPLSEDGKSFVMPDEPVTISFETVETIYHVAFFANGAVWSEANYREGESIILPPDPTCPDGEDGIRHPFTGWTPSVIPIAGGEDYDVTYTAEFASVRDNVEYKTGNDNNRLFDTILPIVGVILLVLAVGLTTFLLLRKRKRRKKRPAPAGSGNPTAKGQSESKTDRTPPEK